MSKFNINNCKFQLGGLTQALASYYAGQYPSAVQYATEWKSANAPSYALANPKLKNEELYGLMGAEDAKRQVHDFISSPEYKKDLSNRIKLSDYGTFKKPTEDQYIQDALNTLGSSKIQHIREVDRFLRAPDFYSNNPGDEIWRSSDAGGVMNYTPGKWRTENIIQSGFDEYGSAVNEVVGERSFFTDPTRQVAINPGVAASKAGKEYWGVNQGTPYDIGKQLGMEEVFHSTQFPNSVESGLEWPRIDTEALKSGQKPSYLGIGQEATDSFNKRVTSDSIINEEQGNPWQTLTPYTQEVLTNTMPKKWELNLDGTDKSRSDNAIYDYLRDPAEMDAKRLSTQVQFGLDPTKKLRMKDLKNIVDNPTLQSTTLLRAVTGYVKPEQSLSGVKGVKARRETLKQLRPIFGASYQEGGYILPTFQNGGNILDGMFQEDYDPYAPEQLSTQQIATKKALEKEAVRNPRKVTTLGQDIYKKLPQELKSAVNVAGQLGEIVSIPGAVVGETAAGLSGQGFNLRNVLPTDAGGNQRFVSDIAGIENPYLKFGVDMITDPTTWAGIGMAKNAFGKKAGRQLDNVIDDGGIDVSSVGYDNWRDEIRDDLLQTQGIRNVLNRIRFNDFQLQRLEPYMGSSISLIRDTARRPKLTSFSEEIFDDDKFKARKQYDTHKETGEKKIRDIQIESADRSGSLSATMDPNTNTWGLSTSFGTNPIQAGKAFKKLDELFPPFPKILEKTSLSLDSYGNVLGMGKRSKHWDVEPKGYIPLNTLAQNNKLLEDLLEYNYDNNYTRPLAVKNNEEALNRLNQNFKYLDDRRAIIENDRIMLPNYQLNRKYKSGGLTNPMTYHNEYPGLKEQRLRYKNTKLSSAKKTKPEKKVVDLSSMSRDAVELRKHIKSKKIEEAIINGKRYQFDSEGRIKL